MERHAAISVAIGTVIVSTLSPESGLGVIRLHSLDRRPRETNPAYCRLRGPIRDNYWVADGVRPAALFSYTEKRRSHERRSRGARRT